MSKYTKWDRLQDRLGANKMAYETEVEYKSIKTKGEHMRHKHADMIHAWANGAEIQLLDGNKWVNTYPLWLENNEYRVKPQPDVVVNTFVTHEITFCNSFRGGIPNVRYVFDGETGALKSVEVLK